MKKLWIFVLIAAFISCSDNDPEPEPGPPGPGTGEEETLVISSGSELVTISEDKSSAEIVYDRDGGRVVLTITADATWDYSFSSTGDDSEWCQISSGDQNLVIRVGELLEDKSRQGTIELTISEEVKGTITIIQNGESNVSLSLGSTFVSLSDEADNREVEVLTNKAWDFSVSSPENWLTVDKSDKGLMISAPENTTGKILLASITVTAGEGDNSDQAEITVIQSRGDMVLRIYANENQEITLPVLGEVDCIIDWGDGSVPSTVQRTISDFNGMPYHTYSEAGFYEVSVTGEAESFTTSVFSTTSEKSFIRGIVQWGNLGFTSLANAFEATPITSIPLDTKGGLAGVESFARTFASTPLTSIPAGLFDGCTKVTNMAGTFAGCSYLSAIPEKLFDKCTKIRTFVNVFNGCVKLTSIPEALFANCPEVTNFGSAFFRCSSLGSIPGKLFAKNTMVTNFENIFRESGITAIPGELFANCPEVTTFSLSFYECASLRSIPGELFSNNKKVSNFSHAFNKCYALGAIPEGLLDNCPLAENFQSMFYVCDNIKSIPSGLFDNCPKADNMTYVFYGTGITEIPSGLFDKCPDITEFEGSFKNCESLAKIPDGLFDNNRNVRTFRGIFENCPELAAIPEKLFANTAPSSNVAFTNAFYGCKKLEEVPGDIFGNLSAVQDFSGLFRNCSSLKNVGNGLFTGATSARSIQNLFAGCTSLEGVPYDIFDDMRNLRMVTSAFENCSSLTGESPYTYVGITKVHLYERHQYSSEFTAPTSYSKCFAGCSDLSDYASIQAAGWN